MGRQSWPGQDGIRIRGSGLAGRSSLLGLASASAGLEDLAGAGTTGAATGTTTTLPTTTRGTTRTAQPSITGMSITGAGMADRKRSAGARGLPQLALQHTEMSTTGRGLRRGRLKETITRPAVTRNLTDKATCTQAHSATMTTAANREAIQREGAPAWAAAFMAEGAHRTVAAHHMAVVARATNGGSEAFQPRHTTREIKEEEVVCGARRESWEPISGICL